MAEPKTKNPLIWILMGVVILFMIFIGIGSYLWGKKKAEEKYTQDRVEIDVRIDSLRESELRLRGSLDSLKDERSRLVTIHTVYKTLYDTVYLKTVPAKIVDGLNTILNTPIPPQE